MDGSPEVVARASTRPEAELIRARLESEGIAAAVLGDDAGGLYPNLSSMGVRVVVGSGDMARATEVLATPTDGDDETG
ncbi:MAG TPA: DUF2007 domain-containing protein [Acidimicrobiia bacterium]|nr:DUF2007 domain-containing protein [Acidimicrobiia bacterium]